eukprot:3191040-Amphidinium_carterae.1
MLANYLACSCKLIDACYHELVVLWKIDTCSFEPIGDAPTSRSPVTSRTTCSYQLKYTHRLGQH